MATKKESSSETRSLAELEEMVLLLEERIIKLEKEKSFSMNNQFEIWMDNKVRGFEYGPDLKKIVMPQSVGKTIDESKKIFYMERDRLIKERYPGRPTPLWT